MGVITYRPIDIVRWLGESSKRDRRAAVSRAMAVPDLTVKKGLVKGIKSAAKSAFGLGKQAMDDLASKKAEEVSYILFDEGFEVSGLMKHIKVPYQDVSEIIAKDDDRYRIEFSGGHATVKPVAHLVSGSLKVPIGWLREGTEVEYRTLIEEIAARSGKDIISE